jgi:hypothetical protein
MLQAFEKFVAVRDSGDGTAFKVRTFHSRDYRFLSAINSSDFPKRILFLSYPDLLLIEVDGMRGNVYVGKAGDSRGTKTVVINEDENVTGGPDSISFCI